jgi:hypothetical protein
MRKSASPEAVASQLQIAYRAAPVMAAHPASTLDVQRATGAAETRSRSPPERPSMATGRDADAAQSRSGSPGPPGLRTHSASCHRSGSRPSSAGPTEVVSEPGRALHHGSRGRSASRSRSLSRTPLVVAKLAAEAIAKSGGVGGEAAHALPIGIEVGASAVSSGLSTSTTTSSSASDSSTSGSSSSSASSSSRGVCAAANSHPAAPPEDHQPPPLRVVHASPPPGTQKAAPAAGAPGGDGDRTPRDGMATATAEKAAAADAASTADAARAEASARVAAPADTSRGALVAPSSNSRLLELKLPTSETEAAGDAPLSAAVGDEPPAESAAAVASLKLPSSGAEQRQPLTTAPGLVAAAEPAQAVKVGARAGAVIHPSSVNAAAAVQRAVSGPRVSLEAAAPVEAPAMVSTIAAAQLMASEGEAVAANRARRKRAPIVWSGVRAKPAQLAPVAVQPAAGTVATPAAGRDGDSSEGPVGAPAKRAVGPDVNAAAALPDAARAASAATAPPPAKRARSAGIVSAAPNPLAPMHAAEATAPAERLCLNGIPAATLVTVDVQQPEPRIPVHLRLGPVVVTKQPAVGLSSDAPADGEDDQARLLQQDMSSIPLHNSVCSPLIYNCRIRISHPSHWPQP